MEAPKLAGVRLRCFRVRCAAVMRGQAPGFGRTLTKYVSQPHVMHDPTNTTGTKSSKPSFRRRMSLAISRPFGARPLHEATDAAGAPSIASPRSNNSGLLPGITEVGVINPTPQPTLDGQLNNIRSTGQSNDWASQGALLLTSSPQHMDTELPPETPTSPAVTNPDPLTNARPQMRNRGNLR